MNLYSPRFLHKDQTIELQAESLVGAFQLLL